MNEDLRRSYLETVHDVYRDAALQPDVGLCCTTAPIWRLPDLDIPQRMLQMNYGCGSTVHPRDLVNSPTVLYVGVGGGMELLQFAYFSRRPGAVIGIDTVDELAAAEKINTSYVSRVLRLTLLAPEIVEAIMAGRQPATMKLADLLEPFPVGWPAQRTRFLAGASPEA